MPTIKNDYTFRDAVYAVVRNIPKGETLSYKQVAEMVGRPKAARAVANILAKNYNPEIPCHRVIRNDGTLSGYNRGGENTKRQLLLTEGAYFN